MRLDSGIFTAINVPLNKIFLLAFFKNWQTRGITLLSRMTHAFSNLVGGRLLWYTLKVRLSLLVQTLARMAVPSGSGKLGAWV